MKPIFNKGNVALKTYIYILSGVIVTTLIILFLVYDPGRDNFVKIVLLINLLSIAVLLFWIRNYDIVRIDKKRIKAVYEKANTINKNLIEKSYLNVIVVDSNSGTVKYINKNSCNLLGFEEAEMVGHSLSNLIFPGRLVSQVKRIKSILSYNEKTESTIIVKDKLGRSKTLKVNCFFSKKYCEYFIFGVDITRIRWSEQSLRNALTEFNALFNNSTIGFIILSEQHLISRINKKGLRMLGYKSGDLNNTPFDVILSEESNITGFDYTTMQNLEVALKHRNGSTVWVLMSIKSITFENIKDGLMLSFQDISEKRTIQKQVEKVRDRYQNLFENTGNATFISASDRTITLCNREMEVLTGYLRKDIQMMKKWDEFISEEFRTNVVSKYNDFVNNEKSMYFETDTVIEGNNNRVRNILMKVYYNTQSKYQAISFVDITSLKITEDKLLETQYNFIEAQRIAKIGYWSINLITKEIYWSDEIYEMFKAPREYTPSIENNIKVFGDQYMDTFNKFISTANNKKSGFELMEYPDFEGGKVVFKDFYYLKTDHNGEPVQVYGLCQDITDQVFAERELDKNKKKLEFVIDSAGIGTWDWNIKCDSLLMNDVWLNDMGYSTNDSEDNFNWEDILAQDQFDRFSLAIKNHSIGRTRRINTELKFMTKSGHWRWKKVIGRTVERDAHGEPERMVGIQIDITHSKEADLVRELIVELSDKFIASNHDNISSILDLTLKKLGEAVYCETVYLYRINKDRKTFRIHHEWCADGILPEIEKQIDWDIDVCNWWWKSLFDKKPLIIGTMDQVPDSESELKQALIDQDVASFLVIPLIIHGVVDGYIGFSTKTAVRVWSENIISLLEIVGNIISKSIENAQYQEIIMSDEGQSV